MYEYADDTGIFYSEYGNDILRKLQGALSCISGAWWIFTLKLEKQELLRAAKGFLCHVPGVGFDKKIHLVIKLLCPLINRQPSVSKENKLVIYKTVF